MPDSPNISTEDQVFLDSLLDRALERLEDGLTVDVEQLLEGHTHMRAEIEDVVRLARQIAIGPTEAAPTVADYTILGELGRGGMGAVYLARQDRLGGRPVALKVLPPAAALSARARDRFLTEAKALAKLRHPNVVAVHDVVHDGDVYAYAMEWVEGKSLDQLIDHLKGIIGGCGTGFQPIAVVRRFLAPPSSSDGEPEQGSGPVGAIEQATVPVFVCRLGIAIARALAAVHEAGLLHRDVKPSNILLRRDGTPLLSDFGLVRETDTTVYTQEGRFLGTPAYAAPEQLRGKTDVIDARTDVYALGVTLYHALSLRLPFRGQSTTDILRQIQEGLGDPLRKANPKLPRDLQTIVAKAMNPDPDRRYATANELADDLDRLLSLQPIKARPAGPVTRTVKFLRRKRRSVVAAAAGSAVAATFAFLAGVYLLWVPGWVDEHVKAARVRLLNPRYTQLVFIQEIRGISRNVWQGSAQGAAVRYDDSVSEYDSALRGLLFRKRYRQIRLERDTVALASTILKGEHDAEGVPDALAKHAPKTAEIGRRWMEAGRPLLGDNLVLDNADTADLRCLGLLAYLCFDPELCQRAFERAQLDLATPPDSLVEVAMAQVHLVYGRGPKAFVRLYRAFQEFEDARSMWVALADAAVRVEELGLAERLLERLRDERARLDDPEQFRKIDPFGVIDRTWAAFFATRDGPGDRERGQTLFAEAAKKRRAPATRLQFAEFLTKWGDFEKAVEVRRPILRDHPEDVGARAAFVIAVQRWWASLDEEGRRRKRADDDYQALYNLYEESVKMVTEAGEPLENMRVYEDSTGCSYACEGYPLQEPNPPLERAEPASPTPTEQQDSTKNP